MITKTEILNYINNLNYMPCKFLDLKLKLNVNETDVKKFGEALDKLVYENSIYKSKNGLYIPIKGEKYKFGKFALMSKGFGFLRSHDEEIFISPNDTNYASNGDIVLVEVFNKQSGINKEGKIVDILERATDTMVGKIHKNKNVVFLVPLDKQVGFDLYITNSKKFKLQNGTIAVAKINKWADEIKGASGKITEILGTFDKKGVDVLSVIKSKGIRTEFSKSCLEEAKRVSQINLNLNRCDFTDLMTFTIDGEDAKDLDDAISLEKIHNHYKLWVHIADVSEYVKENSKLDKEAFKRGTSVYFADRVVPMLPEIISNGCCSLTPNSNKLALSLSMEIDLDGNVKKYDIKKSIINSNYKMTYNDVYKILEGDPFLTKKYLPIVSVLKDMRELMKILNKKRNFRGSVNFEIDEPKFVFNYDGTVKEIIKREITDANRIIEEFMLIANETIAEHMYWNSLPCIYRIHEQPDKEKIDRFKTMLKPLGYTIKNSKDIYPAMFSELLQKIKGMPEEKALTTMMLRSFMKAKYSHINEGHFGLASKYYAHFTSPIRRYPDLVVHRILKESIDNAISEERIDKLSFFTEKASIQSSEKELSAMEAERIVDDIKKAEYMSNFIGEDFIGIISSITSFGIFVELDNTCEGLIRYKDIKEDYFEFDSDNMLAIGERTGKIYKIGDKAKISVISSNPENGEIDFIFSKKGNQKIL